MKWSLAWVGAWVLASTIACGDDAATGAGGSGASGGDGGSGAAGGSGGGGEACCGCLCGDPTWSCSVETCLDDDGKALELVPEAGFFELPGTDYVSYEGEAQSPRARLWYSFQPAESDPGSKPLVILFNGPTGPALGVLAFSTGHFTFDPIYTDGADYVDNPFRWTEFANLIYIDEPSTGFSYNLPREDGSKPPIVYDAYAEGGDYWRVLFRFLERHPQIADVPIVIVGESGGGIRGSYMTKLMLDYQTLLGDGTYEDPELYDEIVAFYGARRSDIEPTEWTPADVAEVLTHQVFIDPMVTTYQWDYLTTLDDNLPEGCTDPPDVLDCSETPEESELVLEHVTNVATDPALFGEVLRVDLTSIEWLYAEARHDAYPRDEYMGGPPVDDSKLTAVFGELEPQDHYYVFNSDDIHTTWDFGTPAVPGNEEHGRVALRSMHDVPTMITNGKYDLRFNAQFIAPSMALYTDVLTTSTFVPTEPAGALRPGQWEIEYVAGLPYGGGQLVIPMPEYPGGHSVTHHAPGELRDDVEAFVAGTLNR